MIRLFIYNKLSGALVSEFLGVPEFVIQDIPANHDFTLTPPPNYSQPWYWYDNKWQSEPKPTP